MTDAPVLVTVLPASTANGVAVPSPTVGWTDAANAAGVVTRAAPITIAATVAHARSDSHRRRGLAASSEEIFVATITPHDNLTF
jgi:hypothetical protein